MMQTLLYADWDVLKIVDAPIPNPGPGEARVKVRAAGICGSELEAVRKHSPRRTPPLILGHEFTGVVDALGPGDSVWTVGDEVVANAVIADGTCKECVRGKTHLCANRQLFGMHRPGAFAEYVVVPSSVLIPRPTSVPPEAAALTEPLANGVHIANLLADRKPACALVFGAGPIGLLAMQALRIQFGSRVGVLDRSEARLDLAKRLGADAVFTPGGGNEVKEWSGGALEATVDAVGAESTKNASVAWLAPGGTAVWIGLHENESPFNAYDLILAEKRLLGSYACTQAELSLALKWMEDGAVDVSSWTSVFPLAEADRAFETMLNPGPDDVKGVIQMS